MKVEILDSFRNLSPIDKIRLKDTSGAMSINDAVKENGSFELSFVNAIKMHIENEQLPKARQKYDALFFVDETGKMYTTGSTVVSENVKDILADVKAVEEEEGVEFSKISVFFDSAVSNSGMTYVSVHFINALT